MINNIFLIKFSELYPIRKFKYAPGITAYLFTHIIFLLFRFIDISKIRLRSAEKISGTFGILFDDIIGGIYTIPIIYLVFLWFGKI